MWLLFGKVKHIRFCLLPYMITTYFSISKNTVDKFTKVMTLTRTYLTDKLCDSRKWYLNNVTQAIKKN